MKINFGYCCISMLHPKLKCGRASTKTYLESHQPTECHDYLIDKARKNLFDLMALLKENQKNGIQAFRMPEQILPQIDLGYYKIEELRDELEMAGRVANERNIQLSTHPSQYYVLNSHREDVVEKTILVLDLFAQTMEMMNLKKVPNMTLHVGVKNGYESADEAGKAFSQNVKRLSEPTRNYLVVENDHVSFCVEDCLKIYEQTGCPIVFDNKHYEWNPGLIPYEEALSRAVHTWGKRTPKLHLSSDREGKKHAHHEMVELSDYRKMEQALYAADIPECNIMLECKKKDEAVLALQKEIRRCII